MQPAVVKEGENEWYVNSDSQYVDAPVAAAVTRMIADHLGASQLFGSVTVGDVDLANADLVLSGKITRFEARRAAHQAEEALISQGGLLWLLLQSTSWRATYEATTQLSDVRLAEAASKRVLWEGAAEGKVTGEDAVEPGGWSVYQEANLSLKAAVENLLDALRVAQVPTQPTAAASGETSAVGEQR
jgi:hypothetical protein